MNKETQSTAQEEKDELIIKIGNKHGLMMHDPIQRYHIGNAMEEYAAHQFKQSPSDAQKELEYERKTRQGYEQTIIDLSKEVRDLQQALKGILAEPYGCPFCDSGKLRTPNIPEKDHDSDCPYLIATTLLENNHLSTHKEEPQGMKWVRAEEWEELKKSFEQWYFSLKSESGNPPLAMQIFYWFEKNIPHGMKPAIEERIKYLKETEAKELKEINNTKAGTERTMKWDFIRELRYRRSELELLSESSDAGQSSNVKPVEFAEWLNENRWFNYDKVKKKWCYTFEHGTAMSDKSYEKNYMKTSEELYRQFLSTKGGKI